MRNKPLKLRSQRQRASTWRSSLSTSLQFRIPESTTRCEGTRYEATAQPRNTIFLIVCSGRLLLDRVGRSQSQSPLRRPAQTAASVRRAPRSRNFLPGAFLCRGTGPTSETAAGPFANDVRYTNDTRRALESQAQWEPKTPAVTHGTSITAMGRKLCGICRT